jgi:hypothetical protein
MLASLLCSDQNEAALRADFQHYYQLDLFSLLSADRCRQAADLAVYLPQGANIWILTRDARAWTSAEWLIAAFLDDFQMYLWAQADRKHRGPKPKPVPRPTDGSTQRRGGERRSDVEAVDVSEFDAKLAKIRQGPRPE